jgi:hypothetical protein
MSFFSRPPWIMVLTLLGVFAIHAVEASPASCSTDTRRRRLNLSSNQTDSDLLAICLLREHEISLYVNDEDNEALLMAHAISDTANSCPILVFEEDQQGHVFVSVVTDDAVAASLSTERNILFNAPFSQVVTAFEQAELGNHVPNYLDKKTSSSWCSSALINMLGALGYSPPMNKHAEVTNKMICRVSQTTAVIDDHLYRTIKSQCGGEQYLFSFYHFGEHLYFVTDPRPRVQDDGHDAGGSSSLVDIGACPPLVFHDNGSSESTSGGIKEMIVVNPESVFLTENGYPFGTFTLSDIMSAFELALEREGEFEIVLSNCATFILSMMQILHLDPDDGLIEYAATNLASNGKTILRLRDSSFLNLLDPDGEEDDVKLVQALINHYIGDKFYSKNLRRGLQGSSSSVAPLCTLCANGQKPTGNLDAFIYKDTFCNGGGDVTCRILEQKANALTQADVDKGLCSGYQELGSIYCGCPERPTALKCRICPGGELPPRSFMEEPTHGCPVCSGQTLDPCRVLVLLASEAENGGDACTDYQNFGLGDCGCPIPAELVGICPLCADGSIVPDPSKQVTDTTTCNGVARLAGVAGAQNPNLCEAFQKVAGTFCDCPSDNTTPTDEDICRICGGNTLLSDPRWAVEPYTDGLNPTSCGFFEVIANSGTGLPCEVFQDEGEEACCGDQPTCSFCANGQSPTTPLDKVLPFSIRTDGRLSTCRDIENLVVGLFSEDATKCEGWHEVTAHYCGCTERNNLTCTLCPDGSLPEDPDQMALFNPIDVDGGFSALHCSTLLRLSAEIDDPESSECHSMQETGLRSCRCPIPEEVKGNCPICKGGNINIPNPDKLILPFTDCDGIARLAATKVGRECEAYQKVAGLYCGCPEKMAFTKYDAACRICGKGTVLSTSDTIMFNGSVISCGELELRANIDQESMCGVYQNAGAGICCKEAPKKKNKKKKATKEKKKSPSSGGGGGGGKKKKKQNIIKRKN